MPEERAVAIALEGVSKHFGKVGAVHNVTLAIAAPEFWHPHAHSLQRFLNKPG